jgi:hypothetical protein
MTKPVAPINTSSSLPTIATSSSRWNYKTVTIILGLTALSLFLYIFRRYRSASTTSPKKNSPPLSSTQEHPLFKYIKSDGKSSVSSTASPVSDRPQPLRKDPSLLFTSGLSYKGKPCVNEFVRPMFEAYASGIIRIGLATFEDFDSDNLFHIQCKDLKGEVFFKACAMPYKGNVDFFIPNLPFKKEITVEFETDKRTIKLKIEQTAGLYTIKENEEDEKLHYESVPVGDSKILTPHFAQDLISLATPFALIYSDGKLYSVPPSKNRNEHLTICNTGERSVIYILLVSNNPALSVEEQSIALPIVINDKEAAFFSLSELENLWASQYNQATGKGRPDGDLQLHLGGHRQIIYPEADEHM